MRDTEAAGRGRVCWCFARDCGGEQDCAKEAPTRRGRRRRRVVRGRVLGSSSRARLRGRLGPDRRPGKRPPVAQRRSVEARGSFEGAWPVDEHRNRSGSVTVVAPWCGRRTGRRRRWRYGSSPGTRGRRRGGESASAGFLGGNWRRPWAAKSPPRNAEDSSSLWA
jgi:hypothetical protein